MKHSGTGRFIPLGLAVAILSTALPYSLEMIALTRCQHGHFGTLMSMEPALAAVSRDDFPRRNTDTHTAAGAALSSPLQWGLR
ncbi:threonine and homoserine efflux system [Escherichia coli]|uniref:Threonine and homoserine efflux system n=1 Tax=Escherichia coli TaxID=562 RepID=A0A376MTZ1_ECOLX|nr:threonine and homoserine efflux system [Escherichia coli]